MKIEISYLYPLLLLWVILFKTNDTQDANSGIFDKNIDQGYWRVFDKLIKKGFAVSVNMTFY